MSKLVVKIRDDDRNFPHCPLQHEGYCHLPQTHYQKANALYMIECLGRIDKRPPWCPLKEEKKAISVEWIKQMANKYVDEDENGDNIWKEHLEWLIKEWEKENAKVD